MTTDHDVTERLRDWLREDRGESADRVVDDVLDKIDWIEQRRPGWLARRLPIMNDNRFRFGIAAAAVVAVAFLGLRFLPASVGGPAPEEIPETAHTSERHQYTLLFPDDEWSIVEREGSWLPGSTFDEGSAGIDVADRVGADEPWVLLASQPLDLEPDAWLERYDGRVAMAFPHCSVESTTSRTVDGEDARVNRYACANAGDGTEAVMFHGDRVYVVRVFDEDPDYDPRPLLDEFLDIFRFAD